MYKRGVVGVWGRLGYEGFSHREEYAGRVFWPVSAAESNPTSKEFCVEC